MGLDIGGADWCACVFGSNICADGVCTQMRFDCIYCVLESLLRDSGCWFVMDWRQDWRVCCGFDLCPVRAGVFNMS